ncbi:MAG: hypothetical protein COA94_05940 [Rickettsiales bacterium]|nr:MAG: hypothetical protein COA94_05940 [Rickettsiales bacterium]
MAGITVTVDGTLSLQQADQVPGCPPPGADLITFPLALFEQGLTGIAGASGSEISQGCFTINSAASFVTLAYPASLRARIFYLRALPGSGALDVRLTHSVAGAVTYPDQYLMLVQFSAVEQLTAIEVQGVGSFAWAAVGVLV